MTILLLVSALFAAPAPAPAAKPSANIALPGGPPVTMDYLAYDAQHGRIWAPGGNTGKVFVVDEKTGKVTPIDGFETAKVKGRDGNERTVGPSSASVGDGFVYVGSRAGAKVCAVDAKTLVRAGCVELSSSPDGVAYVATTHEVWVTTPREKSLTILDVKKADAPVVAGKIALEGEPEGYAVDPGRGLFYTNFEDKDRTIVFDVKTRKIAASWNPGCGEDGPRGIAIDTERRQLFVACTNKVKTLDAGKDGAVLGELETGAGVDNIDYLLKKHLVYAAAGRTGQLTVAEVSDQGALKKVSQSKIAEGGRVVVVDSSGVAYIADSKGGQLLVVKP